MDLKFIGLIIARTYILGRFTLQAFILGVVAENGKNRTLKIFTAHVFLGATSSCSTIRSRQSEKFPVPPYPRDLNDMGPLIETNNPIFSAVCGISYANAQTTFKNCVVCNFLKLK